MRKRKIEKIKFEQISNAFARAAFSAEGREIVCEIEALTIAEPFAWDEAIGAQEVRLWFEGCPEEDAWEFAALGEGEVRAVEKAIRRWGVEEGDFEAVERALEAAEKLETREDLESVARETARNLMNCCDHEEWERLLREAEAELRVD